MWAEELESAEGVFVYSVLASSARWTAPENSGAVPALAGDEPHALKIMAYDCDGQL